MLVVEYVSAFANSNTWTLTVGPPTLIGGTEFKQYLEWKRAESSAACTTTFQVGSAPLRVYATDSLRAIAAGIPGAPRSASTSTFGSI
jgi:hypothetical protein